jgi:hypothetical protein
MTEETTIAAVPDCCAPGRAAFAAALQDAPSAPPAQPADEAE